MNLFAGFSIIAECMNVIPGTIQSCANVLKEGNLLAIAPGGVYESQFSHNYDLMWKKRLGFAKVALEAKVVCIIKIILGKLLKRMFLANYSNVYRKCARSI